MPKIVKVTQTKLKRIAPKNGSIRVGATVNPSQRASAYKYDGYGGTMYIARTRNMKQAENHLLDSARGARYNRMRRSNAQGAPGNVYVIQGRKYSKGKQRL